MKELRRLGSRKLPNGHCFSYSLFICPTCSSVVEKRTGNGIRDKSCGCVSQAIQNKGRCLNTRLRSIYINMISRCYNERVVSYKNYGLRGIKVCNSWKNSYYAFQEWALSFGYSDELQIDRTDVNGNYCPENCKFVTQKEQARNKTNTKCNKSIAEILPTLKLYTKLSDQKLADMFNIHRRTVNFIINKKQWV